MAEKVLKIRLVANSEGLAELIKQTDSLGKAIDNSSKKVGLEARLTEELRRLQEKLANEKGVLAQKIQSANDLLNKGIQNQGLAWYNAQRALTSYNKATEGTRTAISALQEALAKLQAQQKYFFSNALQSTPLFKPNSDYGIALKDGMTAAGMKALRDKAAAEQALRDQSLARFNSYLSEQEKRLAASIERQKAIQIHGINSIEARKVQAAENERRLQTQLQQNLENLRTKISTGTISPSLANAEARRHLQGYRQAILDTNKALLEQEQAHERAQNSFSRLAGRIFEIIGIYRVYNFVLNSITNSIKAIPNIGIQLEATKAVLEVTEKSTNGMLVTLDALTKEAKRSGIQIGAIRENFRTFSASASLAGESGEDIWRMFTNINTVSAALHLTADQTNHVFLALAQIFNKTKVQSEELVKQLGNLLPGAFASFAKANEHAFKNIADLVSKLKAGVVDAHSTMLRFTQFMADRLAVAFLAASHGLNFALNNMKTSFTLLGEAIYGSTSGGLITASKLLESFADIIRKDIEGLNILGETIKTVLILGLSAGIVKLVSVVKGLFGVKGAMAALTTQMTATQFALGRVQAAFAFLSSPTAIIAGIGLLISKFYELRTARIQALEESDKVAEGLAKALERQKLPESQRAEFDVENAPEVVAQKKTLESLQKTQKTMRDIIGGIPKKGDLFFEFWDNYARKIEQTKNNIQELKKVAKEQIEANSLITAPDSLAAVEEAKKLARIEKLGAIGTPEALKEQATLQKTKQLQNEMVALERDTARANEEIEKLLASAKGNPEQKQALIEELRKRVQENEQAQKDFQFAISNAGNKETQTGLKTQFREEYKEIIRDTQDFVREIENKVFQLENAFELRQVPIEEYFVKKQELIIQSFNEQIAAMQEAANKAFSNKDLAKGNEYSHKVKDLEQQKYKEIENLGKQLILTQEAYNSVLSQTNSEFLKIVGNAKQAAEIDFNLQHAEDYKQFLQEGNQEYLQKLDFLKRDYVFQQSIAELEQQRTNINSNYEAQLQNINALYNVGSITQIDSLFRTSELNRKRIIELEEIIQKEEKILQLHAQNNQFQGNGPLLIYMNPDTSGLQQAKRELEQLRIEGNAVANFFRQTFTNSFKESFADIITGQKDVKIGFKDLLSSIIEEMAGFIADAIVKQFFSLIAQMFQSLASSSSSAGGGIFGSLFELFVGAAASSKGNIVSNNNIVPFAKGGIPDIGNKMQYFPLANGGIGSLRENNKYEAILPLHRDASGSLGVKANISPLAQSAGNVYNITVHVQSGKDDKPAATGDKVAEAIVRRIAREEAGKMQRNTSYANKNQKFG